MNELRSHPGENLRRNVRPEIREWAKEMRCNPAAGEAELWERLRAKRLGFRFHRQAVLRGWIADFWCPAKRLVVEIDGVSHQNEYRRTRDSARDKTLLDKLGIRTLRFPLELVQDNLDEVVDKIRCEMKCRPTRYLRFERSIVDRVLQSLANSQITVE